jgi:hypothetical protein
MARRRARGVGRSPLIRRPTPDHATRAPTSGLSSAADPELSRYHTEFVASLNLQVRRILEAFHDRGWLRGHVSFDELAETTAVLCSEETYLRFTQYDGWSSAAYQAWVRRMLAETVFASPPVI